jgi:hypothetical protein
VGTDQLVDTQTKQVLFLLGVASKELEDDMKTLDTDIWQRIVRQDLPQLARSKVDDNRRSSPPILATG